MAAGRFIVMRCPSDELSLSNKLVFNPNDMVEILKTEKLQELINNVYAEAQNRYFGIASHQKVPRGKVGLSGMQREFLGTSEQTEVDIKMNSGATHSKFCISSLTVEADFLLKKNITNEAYDTDKLQTQFRDQFNKIPFYNEQRLAFKFEKLPYISLKVKSFKYLLEGQHGSHGSHGILNQNTLIVFDKNEESVIKLTGKSRGKSAMPNIINPDWNFSQMGIGGLDNEFSGIFRRAFASRVFPPDLIEDLGMQHVKGILLYGPPGTGKTLMARQIGKMLNAREPKIVNGPEILNKYVGESEANIRKLFEDAEADQKKLGSHSGLHIIILDEIDAICKQRGTVSGSTGVSDTVVNQLLSKIDGVEQLNNILLIGMTNRKDLIDDALLRPGRLEVQMEISLPNEKGRVQILNIHTAKLKANYKLEADFDIDSLAAQTKNFSGAELEGVVRAATTTAMNRLVKADSAVKIDPDAVENLKVSQADFLHAIENDIKPAFGAGVEDSDHYMSNGIIKYSDTISHILQDGQLLIKQTRLGQLVSPVTVLLEGPGGSGKTALAAHLAYKMSEIPFIKVVSAENMIGFSESAKCQAIRKVFDDAYRSELSCIIVDDIERLIDYVPIGPRFSNIILQALIVLLKKKTRRGKKLLIIATTSSKDVLNQMGMLNCFNTVIHVPTITRVEHLIKVVDDLDVFSYNDKLDIKSELEGKQIHIAMKHLISLVEMANQHSSKASKFISLLEEQGALKPNFS